MKKNVSILIPIFNEEEILEQAVANLTEQLEQLFDDFEIVISENGSTDNTRQIMAKISATNPRIKTIEDPSIADYGQALIDGINACTFDEICILELDYLDIGFLTASYARLADADLIVGSKKISPGIDQRPWKRKFFSTGYNTLLRLFFGLTLTETHGLKTFRKSKLLEIANNCVTRHAVYPSEFVPRACRDPKIKAIEIPLTMPLVEIRTTRISASKRLKKTLSDLRLLHGALRASDAR